MLKVHPITRDNLPDLQGIYARFSEKARSEYHWSQEAIPFDLLRQLFAMNAMRGYWIEDTSKAGPAGFMLYVVEEHRAIEINLIYSESADRKTVLDRLMRRFLEDIAAIPGWDVVSYAMLGEQAHFIRTITWYGFAPVGQVILKFDMMDAVSVQILKQQQLPALPPGYRLDSWRPEYSGATAEIVYTAFSPAVDARWDPRFRTLLGARKVVAMITADMMGTHFPACTTLLLKDGHPVGFCFLIQGEGYMGNVPLIAIQPDQKGKGLGNHLLKATLDKAIDEMLAARIAVIGVDATTDTDNFAALHMYRRMGFRDFLHYPHVYLPRERLAQLKPGQWCVPAGTAHPAD